MMTGYETSKDTGSESGVGTRPARRRGRPNLNAPNVPELLLAAGIEQFALHGFDGVGLREIAAQAHVNAAMVVHHFGSKQGLWEAAIDDLSARLLRALEDAPDGQASGAAVDRLNDASAHLIDLMCDRPELASFILREVVLENDRSEYSHLRLIRPIHDRLGPIIADYAEESAVRLDADYLFVALMGAIATAIAARRLFGRLLRAPADDREFRAELRAAIAGQMAARTGVGQKDGPGH